MGSYEERATARNGTGARATRAMQQAIDRMEDEREVFATCSCGNDINDDNPARGDGCATCVGDS